MRRVLGSRRGASAAEFAIISGPFFLLVLGIVEAAWQLATGTALDHAALRASRYGITGSNAPPASLTANQQNVPTCRTGNIRWMVARAAKGIVKDNSDLVITTRSWAGLSASRTGAGAAGPGAANQIVSYEITYRQRFITGIVAQTVFGGSYFQHRAFIVVRNEPFQNAPC